MKSILTRIDLVGSCIPVVTGAAQIVSEINAPPAKHELANVNTPLCSNLQNKIDRERQIYEGLPDLFAARPEEPPSRRVEVIGA